MFQSYTFNSVIYLSHDFNNSWMWSLSDYVSQGHMQEIIVDVSYQYGKNWMT